jgi:hypothetical protein
MSKKLDDALSYIKSRIGVHIYYKNPFLTMPEFYATISNSVNETVVMITNKIIRVYYIESILKKNIK